VSAEPLSLGIAEWGFLLGVSRINAAWEKFLAASGTALTNLGQRGGNEIVFGHDPDDNFLVFR